MAAVSAWYRPSSNIATKTAAAATVSRSPGLLGLRASAVRAVASAFLA